MSENNSLLESGTNEVDIIEFMVGKIHYGINVFKVREVITGVEATSIPESHPCIEGVIKLRGEVITLVDLIKYLKADPSSDPENDKIIITEFNQFKAAFRVKEVVRIHRISWEQIQKTPPMLQGKENCTTGIIKLEDRIILLLDFEKIMVDIEPEVMEKNLRIDEEKKVVMSDKKIMLVEDSAVLRKILTDYLPRVGYDKLIKFENGRLAWEYLENLAEEKKEQALSEVDLVITDIEMPLMDGHHLTKKIKEHPILSNMPVVIFSSLITNDLFHRGQSVGADAQLSKPKFKDLSKIIAELTSPQNKKKNGI